MSGNRYDRRPQWRREVLRSARLHPTTKLVLLVLHDHMRPDGKVSVSRRTVADKLGWRHTQRVSERITHAHEAGFLVTVIEGSYGRTATWQGVLPGDVTVCTTRTVSAPGFPDGYDPSNRPVSRTPLLKRTPVMGHRPQRRQRWEEQTI
jgi:hypothetical protein